jgi:hypothetical protein
VKATSSRYITCFEIQTSDMHTNPIKGLQFLEYILQQEILINYPVFGIHSSTGNINKLSFFNDMLFEMLREIYSAARERLV